MQNNEVLAVAEAAKWCGVSVRTALNWIERGELKSYKLPGRGDNRICMVDFVDFLTRHKMPLPDRPGQRAARVLIVDQDQPTGRVITNALKGPSYETRLAQDGFSAGALLGSFRPDLLILGQKLPALDLIQVVTFMRANTPYREIKVLVVSLMPREKLVQAGADDVLAHPLDPNILQEKVAFLLEMRIAS